MADHTHQPTLTAGGTLATGYATLDAIQATLHRHAGRAGHLLATFMAAATAAAAGRDALLAAPSLPRRGDGATFPGWVGLAHATPELIVDTLAATATALSGALAAAAAAASPPDQAPLEAAAAFAVRVQVCLNGTG